MIEVTGAAQTRAWAEGILPPVEQVRPGLWSIPVPIPDNPLRYVLVYALVLTNGVAIIDAGWDTEEAWESLGMGLRVAGFELTDVRSILVTHIHPDHYGLAGRVREASGAPIALHAADAALITERYAQVDDLLGRVKQTLARWGVPASETEELSSAAMEIRDLVGPAYPDILLGDGDRPHLPGWSLQAIWTPGHSPGHLCFYDSERRLLVSGDHVLPRISPNVSVHPQQRENPLADFLDSLEKVSRLPVDEVLPAHEYRFRNLAHRVAELGAHHAARLDELAALTRRRPGATVWELALRLTWSRPWEQFERFTRRAALGETLAHLLLLELQQRVWREPMSPERWHPRDGRSGEAR